MTMREERAELSDRLKKAADRTQTWGGITWEKTQLVDLLDEATLAVTRCPHEGCAYCYTIEKAASPEVEREETG